LRATVDAVTNGGANGVIMHKGLPRLSHRRYGKDVGLIIHLSASTDLSSMPNKKTIVCSVEESIRLGADAVSIHVNIGDDNESMMLADFGEIGRQCDDWGMPLVAMVYPRGPKIKDQYAVEVVKHAARVGAELGADLVKVPFTGSVESFREVVEGCQIPVLIAGGPKMDADEDVLRVTEQAIAAGGAGVSIGRNIFQSKNPERIMRAIAKIVHDGESADVAAKEL
jgi:class I fructose-bisphosphate aldolase